MFVIRNYNLGRPTGPHHTITSEKFIYSKFIKSIIDSIDLSGAYINKHKNDELNKWIIANTSSDLNRYREYQVSITPELLSNVAYNWLKHNDYISAAKIYKERHQLYVSKGLLNRYLQLDGIDDTFKKYLYL